MMLTPRPSFSTRVVALYGVPRDARADTPPDFDSMFRDVEATKEMLLSLPPEQAAHAVGLVVSTGLSVASRIVRLHRKGQP